jgi:hypothetical protein
MEATRCAFIYKTEWPEAVLYFSRVFRNYSKPALFVDLWQAVSTKYGHINDDQWNRIEDPDMKPHNYNQLVFDKGAKNMQWRKDSLFNKNCGKTS